MDYHPGKNSLKTQLKEFFLPSPFVWLLYFLISGLVVVIVNFQTLWHIAANYILGPASEVGAADYSLIFNPFFKFTDKLDTPLLMLFWAMIGGAVYVIIFFFEQFFSIANAEVQESEYLVGGISSQKNYWQRTVKMDLFLILLIIGWIGYIMVYVQLLLPWVSRMLIHGIDSWSFQKSPLAIVGSLLLNTLAVYLFLLVRQLLVRVWRLVRP